MAAQHFRKLLRASLTAAHLSFWLFGASGGAPTVEVRLSVVRKQDDYQRALLAAFLRACKGPADPIPNKLSRDEARKVRCAINNEEQGWNREKPDALPEDEDAGLRVNRKGDHIERHEEIVRIIELRADERRARQNAGEAQKRFAPCDAAPPAIVDRSHKILRVKN